MKIGEKTIVEVSRMVEGLLREHLGRLNQVEIMQVFLSYVYFPAQKKTYFEKIKGSGYLMLTEKT